MQAEYKKEWMDTYLWIVPEKEVKEEYIEKMLLFNQGEGRLEFSLQQEEGQTRYCYKITGKKALHGIYAVMSIGERQIKHILMQLFEILERGKEYLLSEEDFVIQPNYIYASLPKMTLELCYVPGYGVPLREQLENFLEYLLNRVDYEDKRAVELLYDCYMFCVREQGGLREMCELFEQEERKETEQWVTGSKALSEKRAKTEEAELHEEPEEIFPEDREKKQKKVSVYKKNIRAEEKAQVSYMAWLTQKLFHKKEPGLSLVAEEPEEYQVTPKIQAEEEQTVVLSVRREKEEAQLLDDATGEMIFLQKSPFYIGSVAKYADYVPKTEGVSRIHCSITKREENYYLSDLNSTNGTRLNGREILPGKEELLSDGDEITVARGKFYIKFSCCR